MLRGHKRGFIAVFFRQSLTPQPQILTKGLLWIKNPLLYPASENSKCIERYSKICKKNKDRRAKKNS